MLDILYNVFIFPIEQIIGLLYVFSLKIFKDPAWAILGVSVGVNIIILPLYYMAERYQHIEWELQKRMKPDVDDIKSAFSGNERFMRLSAYYRQNGYRHLYSLRSSISVFIQVPFFIAAYHYLSHLEIIQGIAFGPIEDLAKPDALLKFNNIAIHILPVVMTVINLASGAVYAKGLPSKDKMQLYGMAGLFLFLLYNSPSGLVLYWTTNNIFSLFKNILQNPVQKQFTLLRNKIKLISIIKSKADLLKNNSDTRLFILGMFILFLLFGLVIPSTLIASDYREYSFVDGDQSPNPVYFIVVTALQSLGIFVFWPLCIYWMCSEKNKKYLLTIVMVFIGIAMVNVFLFPGKYGALSIVFTFSEKIEPSGFIRIFNLFAVILISVLAIITVRRFRKLLLQALMIFLCSLILISTLNIAKIKKEFQYYKVLYFEGKSTTDKYLYRFSKNGKNVLVILLDGAMSGYLPFIFDERPALKNSYEGFTWYRNTVSFGSYTKYGIPSVFGGYEYTPLEMNARKNTLLVEKHNEALMLLPKLFLDQGYTISVTNPPLANYVEYSDITIFNDYPQMNVNRIMGNFSEQWLSDHEDIQPIIISTNIESCLIRFSFFKTSPVLFRKYIYRWLDNTRIVSYNSLYKNKLDRYIELDVLPDVTSIDEAGMNTYNVVYNEFTHDPCFMKFPDYIPSNNITNRGDGPFANEGLYHSNIAALILVGKWLDFLKNNNVYDNTRIIIVSDHGLWKSSPDYMMALPNGDPLSWFAPILLVKDFDSHGTLSVNNEFMTHSDVPLIALKDIIERPVNPWTGKILKADKDSGIVITSSRDSFLQEEIKKYQFDIKSNEWLHVRDNIFEIENWNSVNR